MVDFVAVLVGDLAFVVGPTPVFGQQHHKHF